MKTLYTKSLACALAGAALFAVGAGVASASTPSSYPHASQTTRGGHQFSTGTLNSKSYSLTTDVENDTPVTLTLIAESLDNGATWESTPLPTSLAPDGQTGDSAVIKATNTGNGIHMWLTFQAPNGDTIQLTPNVPKVSPNTSFWNASGPNGLGLSHLENFTTGRSIGTGDNPTATYKIDYCSPNACSPL